MTLDGKVVELKKAYSSILPHRPSFVGFYTDAFSLEPDHEYRVELNLPLLQAGQFQGLFCEIVESEYTDRIDP
jgi:hypothetical protein